MRLRQLVLVLAVGVAMGTARADEPKPKPLTPEQRAKLKERDRLAAEAGKLWAAGKQEEAISALQKELSIERDVSGDTHEQVAVSLRALAWMYEQREDFMAARPARREVLAIRTRLHGEKDWRVTDARLDLEDLELKARLDTAGRQKLRQANDLNQQMHRLYQQGRSREALPLARRALAICRDIQVKALRRKARQLGLELVEPTSASVPTAATASAQG